MVTEEQVNDAARRLRVTLEKMLDPAPSKLPASLKICSECGELKSVDSFYRFRRSRDGRLGRCKSCFLSRREILRERRDRGELGKSTPVASETELRAALKSPEVFRSEPA